MVVAYDNLVRYPYWWYMRHYPNKIDFDVNPTLDVRRALVIAVGAENYSKIEPVVRNDYNATDAMLLWWPNEDYFSLKLGIHCRRETEGGCPTYDDREYLKSALGAYPAVLHRPEGRSSAVWQIWFNRDYTQWAALKKSDGDTLTNWGVSHRMRYYVRKDIASQIWTYTSVVKAVAQPVTRTRR